MTVVLLALVFIPMIVEARRASRNERLQRSRGGIEAPHDVYRVMRVAYPAAFVAMIAEPLYRGTWGYDLFLSGLALFFAAKALKWWAIETLGPFWTFRVIVVPGAPLVTTGPYTYLRHPNYVAVVGELVGVAMMADARITGPAATLVFGAIMLRRIVVEQRALGKVQSAP